MHDRQIFLLTLMSLMSMTTAVYPQQTAEAPAAPPEVKKTVDALVGHWSFAGTDAEPGTAEAAKVTMAFDCVTAALGAAVACTFAGQPAGVGRVEAAAVIGYSPDEKAVRASITNTEEFGKATPSSSRRCHTQF